MSLRIFVLLLASLMLVVGATFLVKSAGLPEWTDESRAVDVQSWPMPDAHSGKAYDDYNARWHAAINALRTEKWPYFDAGAGLIAFAFSLAAGVFLLRVRRLSDVAALTTPRSRWAIFLLVSAGWLAICASALAEVYESFDKFEQPTWADTLAIPLAGTVLVLVAGMLTLGVVMLFVLWRARLPASIWIWKNDALPRSVTSSAIAALLLVFGAENMREAFLYGHWSAMPASFLWGYAVLALRAASISRATSTLPRTA